MAQLYPALDCGCGGSGVPSGPAGGDLSGTYPNPKVDGSTVVGDFTVVNTGNAVLAPTGRIKFDSPISTDTTIDFEANIFMHGGVITEASQVDNAGSGIQIGNNELVTIGAGAPGSIGLNLNTQKIENVAAGAVATDAANVGQIFSSYGGGAIPYSAGATLFFNPNGQNGVGSVANTSLQSIVITKAGVLTDLFVNLDGAPGAAQSVQYVVFINGAASLLAVTISGAGTTGFDTTDKPVVAPGDIVSMAIVGSAAAVAAASAWGFNVQYF